MVETLRWNERSPLTDDVRAAMREVLAEALREAARTEDPGDGSTVMLGVEGAIGDGMWAGSWKLQSYFVEDVRMNPRPFVVVCAHQGGHLTKASVAADVVRTPADRLYLVKQRLDAVLGRRDATAKLTEEVQAAKSGAVSVKAAAEQAWKERDQALKERDDQIRYRDERTKERDAALQRVAELLERAERAEAKLRCLDAAWGL